MVSTSKILTVSYGTFSCTLEGFDDSFETMKAIAEYFRDLAAEDRYFGAEPPVPDAEMLARIAEREIARRVEAREERGSIVLRAQPYGAVSAPLAPQPAPAQAAPAQPAAFAPAPLVQPQAPVAAPAAAAPAEPQPAESQPVDTAETPAAVPDSAEPVSPQIAATAPVAAPEVSVAADEWEDVSLDAFSSEGTATPPVTTAAPRHTPVPHPDPESVAAKLQRIRDVVSKTAATPAPESYSEDEHAESFLAETAQGIETALAEDAAADQDFDDDDSDEIAALLGRLTGEKQAEAVADAAPEADDLVAEDADDVIAEDAVAPEQPEDDRIGDALRAEWTAESADANDAGTEPQDDAAALDDAALEDEDEDDLVDIEIAADEDDDAAAAGGLPARVIKMKRADFEAALAAGELVPEDDMSEDDLAEDETEVTAAATTDDAGEGAPMNGLRMMPGAGLSPQEEADLRRELAAVEAELVDIYRDTEDHADPRDVDDIEDEDDDLTSLFEDDDEDDLDKASDTAPLVLRDPREQLTNVRAEDDMSRLMAKAESAMTEPESANRRNAIAHLRAAVAATKAEQSAGNLPAREAADNAFRDDLASVVRPRRPMGEAAAATPRPAEARPAPLKLVAEQRVDLPRDSAASPVRPRRVSLAPLADDAQDMAAAPHAPELVEGEFAEFARKMGATALPDLLEAAAAYLVHVEARDEFSRPQLMNKARQGTAEALSREDGLRAFGQLLRQGKIQKVRGGRFTAAEDIGFKPAARRAG